MKYTVSSLLITVAAITLIACNKHNYLETHSQTGCIDTNLLTSYNSPQSSSEEYVARVGKRVLLVSDNPNSNYKFLISAEDTPELLLSKKTNSITLSEGLLSRLRDEAELAAVLTMAMSKMAYYADLDRNALTELARAGYDPAAMVDLQEQYFLAGELGQKHWLSVIYHKPPTEDAIAINRAFILKMPKGLLRGSETYHKQIKG